MGTERLNSPGEAALKRNLYPTRRTTLIVNSRNILIVFAALVPMSALRAQTFDTSGNGLLHGDYFVREVLIANQHSDGTISSASSAVGVATFDGKGNYTFTGQGMSSSSGANSKLSLTGTYKLASNGFLIIQSFADPNNTDYGGVAATGPSAFVGSTTEGTNDASILIGIPAASNVSNSALNGNYTAASIDFINADITMQRESTFTFAANGSGSIGNIAVAGTAANLNSANPLNQNVSGVTYSLAGEGSGTINLGPASSSQLISGTKNLYISADRSIVIGGSPTGFDLFVALPALTSNASNATTNGIYYIAGLENLSGSGGGADSFWGSLNSNGAGISLVHNRFKSFTQPTYDYTFDTQYAVAADGTISPSDILYNINLGLNGQAFVATGTNGLYSLFVGFAAPKFSGSGVYLNPLGVVSAANFAPATNPIAPNELVALVGTGFASSLVQAANLPLPTSLAGVQVTVNGIFAPLFYVSPTQIAIEIPTSISPANGVPWATIQVISSGTKSNPVTVATRNTAPGVFALNGAATGPAAAEHANFSIVNSSNPAQLGETIIVYTGGLGAVTPAIPDGSAAPSTPPLSTVNEDVATYISGMESTPSFKGLTPTTSGLYQLNVAVPSGSSPGDVYVNASTDDAYTSMATINVAPGMSLQMRAAGRFSSAVERRKRPAAPTR